MFSHYWSQIRSFSKMDWSDFFKDMAVSGRIWVQENAEKATVLAFFIGVSIVVFFKIMFTLIMFLILLTTVLYISAPETRGGPNSKNLKTNSSKENGLDDHHLDN